MGGIPFRRNRFNRREKLIGAIIVGVGLPQICFERNIIKDYFTYNLDEGFEYAYVYPGYEQKSYNQQEG